MTAKSYLLLPLHMVAKENDMLRPYKVYHGFNSQTSLLRCTVHHIMDLTRSLQRKQKFSEIDLVCAYYQIPVNAEDILKTAIRTLACSAKSTFIKSWHATVVVWS